MILWREKFRAFGIHFATTLIVALLAAALIFLVWYPAPFGTMVGGLKLFMLVTGCAIQEIRLLKRLECLPTEK